MEAGYATVGWRYRLVCAGASIKDSKMAFHLVGRGYKALERGFLVQVEKCKASYSQTKMDCPEEVTKVMRVSS